MKVSVIIPVYNMQEYIGECIESVMKQSLKSVEIICVDDGSTDKSREVIAEKMLANENIRYFYQNNQGSGVARNLGIRKAKGKYVCFLDADDRYASGDVLEYLFNLIETKKVQICGGSSCDYFEGRIKRDGIRKERIFNTESFINNADYPGFVGYWAFLFNKEFLINNKIFFPPYYRGQDAPFFTNAIAKAGGAYCSKKMILFYRKNHKAVTYTHAKALDMVRSIRDVLSISLEYKMKHVYQEAYDEFQGGEIGALVYKFCFVDSVEMKVLLKEINKLIVQGCETFKFSYKSLYEGEELREYVVENDRRKLEFIEKVSSGSKVFIYGAGTLGRKVACFLIGNNISIDSFLVSNRESNPRDVYGIPIHELKKEYISGNYIIIIATYGFSQKEIAEKLQKEGISNIYMINVADFFLWQKEIAR